MLLACEDKATYRVKVKLDNLPAQEIYAVFESDDAKLVDTIAFDGNKEFTVTEMESGYNTLTLYFQNKRHWITLYLEPFRKLYVTGDAQYPELAQVKGTKINESLSAFHRSVSDLIKEQTDLFDMSDMYRAQGSSNSISTPRLDNIRLELCKHAETYIKKHPDDQASVVLIKNFFSNADKPEQIDELLDGLSPKVSDFYLYKRMKTFCEKAKRMMIGAEAPDFDVKNIYGQHYNINSFTGRYLALTFIARWEDNCQTEELMLNKIIRSHTKDSLEVLLVSLDENPQEVRNYIKNDSIAWNIVTDSAGQAIHLFDLYNVKTVPYCFLINTTGEILLKTENGLELQQMLDNLVEKQ